MEPVRKEFRFAGPVAQAFEFSRSPVAVIVGPTGGGKSTAAARRVFRVAQLQDPSPRDGKRKARIVVIAPTYRRLWDQVIPSYFKEINRGWGKATGAKGDPLDHVFDIRGADGIDCHIEVLFRAVGDTNLEEFFRGFEVTAAWLPEADTHHSEDILSLARNRVGRYPEPDDRPEKPEGAPAAYAGVWCDANAPEIDTWFHERFYLRKREGDAVFIQPSGYSPARENWENLRKINPRYYEDMAKGLDPWAVKRLIENKPGYSRHGQPVHEHFDALRMIAPQPIEAEPGEVLVIGADCGNTLSPAATFMQRIWGQVRVLHDITPDGQMDMLTFAKEVRRIRETKYRHVKRAVLVIDPSARSKSAVNMQLSFAMILQAETEIEVTLAPTNDPLARRTALDQVMKRSAGPGEPGFLVDPECIGLIKALAGGYCFARKGQSLSLTPAKTHPHSDIADACQYGVLGMEGIGAGGGFIHQGAGGRDAGDLQPILQD